MSDGWKSNQEAMNDQWNAQNERDEWSRYSSQSNGHNYGHPPPPPPPPPPADDQYERGYEGQDWRDNHRSEQGYAYGSGSGHTRSSDIATEFLSSLNNQLIEEGRSHGSRHEQADGSRGGRDHDRDREREDRDKYRSSRYDRDQERDNDRDRNRERHRRSRSRERRRSKERRRERSRSRDRHRDDTSRRRRSSRERDYDDRDRRSRRSRRSRSPSPESRILPLHKWPRKLNHWDVPPPGYEHCTAEQVKASGLFPLPGQPASHRANFTNIPALDPTRAALLMSEPPMRPPRTIAPLGTGAQQSQGRQARRIYVGQIPLGISEDAMAKFFNDTMIQLSLNTTPGNPVISVQINHEKNYAFVEFRVPEEATAAMAFDGIAFQGQQLKIRRPKDYQPPPGGETAIHVPGVISSNVPDSPHKIFIGGLPPYLNDEQVMELLRAFGELRAFHLVKDVSTGQSKGFAFCEFADPNITDIACQGLNQMELGDRKLVVQRASVGSSGRTSDGLPLPGMALPMGEVRPTTVLQLMNMVTPEELEDDEEYQEILEDVRDECLKFGQVTNVKIPRPQGGQVVPGLGKIFVQYENVTQAQAASAALAGRKFADRVVLVSYIEEERFYAGDFE
ncbi:uncharacterized protein VTP21DRAFT_3100 [Calcarisporiella thermophila]|uniref:uncharacterized protein n=1 Tax=Calcarisporiella thermophila TaxID=911321 RepID=UPI0037426A9D